MTCDMTCRRQRERFRRAEQAKRCNMRLGKGAPLLPGICCIILLYLLTRALCSASQWHQRLPLLLHQRPTGLAACESRRHICYGTTVRLTGKRRFQAAVAPCGPHPVLAGRRWRHWRLASTLGLYMQSPCSCMMLKCANSFLQTLNVGLATHVWWEAQKGPDQSCVPFSILLPCPADPSFVI